MHKFSETKILPYNFKEVYALVLDIEKYPEFLPWVSSTKIITKNNIEIIADMTANFKTITQSYRSKIMYLLEENSAKIEVNATSGVFKHLQNLWSFTDKGKESIVQFDINFEFQSKLLDSIASPLFTAISQQMILAFEKRAKEKYYGTKSC